MLFFLFVKISDFLRLINAVQIVFMAVVKIFKSICAVNRFNKKNNKVIIK